MELNKYVHMSFLDLAKSFDRMRLRDVLKLLKEQHQPNSILATRSPLAKRSLKNRSTTYGIFIL